ncbi:MAG: cellulase-like family protein [Aquabacterium sp.]|nr:cellulase-like family protein [Aquabacterium sp.]
MRHLPTPSDCVPATEANPRRDALKHIAAAGVGAMALSAPSVSQAVLPFPWSAPAQGSAPVLNVRRPTLAMCLLDFTWLTRRDGPQPEYRDFDVLLDSVVLRGYNCLRIDAFPHFIAADDKGRRQDEFVIPADTNGAPWGVKADVTVNPRRDLPIFLSKCAARGIRVTLSTWMYKDKTERARRVQSPAQLSRIWAETLDFIGQHGLMDIIEFVDLANEFPSVQFMPAIVDHINQKLFNKINLSHGFLLPYDQRQASAISAYIYAAINGLKKQFPKLPLCVSLAGDGTTNTFKFHDLSPMDCIETHIWLSQNQAFGVPSGLALLLLQSTGKPQSSTYNNMLEKWAQSMYYRRKTELLKWLGCAMDSWVTLGNKLNVPVYTSEGWAVIAYPNLPDKDPTGANWAWIPDADQHAVVMAKARGWSGIVTNYVQPQFPPYKDIAWHQQITGIIKSAR